MRLGSDRSSQKPASPPVIPVILLAILLFAAGLYLIGVNGISLWEDESWMGVALRGDLPSVWTFAAERGVHPPLYFLLGWFYTRLAGDGEIALRWLAGLCALVGVACTYRAGADWYGRRAGIYAALLAAGSLFLIYFGRLARHYTLFFALAAAQVWLYERWTRRPQTNGGLAAVALLQAAALYTHYYGIWMALVLGLHGLFVLRRRDWLRLAAALALGGVLFLPWLPPLLGQIRQGQQGLGYATRDAGYAIRSYIDRVWNGDYLLGAALTVIGAAAAWRTRRKQAGLLLLIWLTIPLILSLLLNTRFVWFIERNMIFTLSGVCILFGAGLAWISRYPVGRVAAAAAALVFVAAGIARYPVFWPFVTPDWRGIADVMAAEARPDDLFVLRGEPYSLDYYLLREMGQPAHIVPLNDWLQDPGQPERVWLVDAGWAVRFEAIDALPPDALLTRRYVLGVLVAEFYQRAPAAPLVVFGQQIALGMFAPPGVIEAAPGQTLDFDLWWRAAGTPQADYSVGLYLLAEDGRVLAQQDGGFDRGRVPAPLLPADRWTPDARALLIPADVPPGEYPLTVAVYDWRDGARLLPADGNRADNAYLLATVRVRR